MTRRSTLYVWMLENHDAFDEVIKKAVRPNWNALAQTFGEEGQTDADGKPPTAECTRQTWWKVRKVVAARRKAAHVREGTQAASVRPPQSPPSDPSPTHSDQLNPPADKGEEEPRRTFGVARLRGNVPSPDPASPTPAPTPAPSDPDRAARVIADLMRGGTTNPFKSEKED